IRELKVEAEALRGGASVGNEVPCLAATLSLCPVSDSQVKNAIESVQRQVRLLNDPVVGRTRDIQKLLQKWHPPSREAVDRHRCFAELLPDLALLYGVQFIADAYYYRPSRQLADLLEAWPKRVPLLGFLEMGGRWQHDGDLITLRNREWFLARPREVPLRF